MVKFDTSRYTVPSTYASRTLTLKADHQLVSIYDKGQLIARHHRAQEKNTLVEDPRHSKGLLQSKPNAIFFKNRDALLALGDVANHYFEAMCRSQINIPHHVKKIMALLDLYGKTEVLSAMDHAMKYGAFGHEYPANIIPSNHRRHSSPHPLGPPSSKLTRNSSAPLGSRKEIPLSMTTFSMEIPIMTKIEKLKALLLTLRLKTMADILEETLKKTQTDNLYRIDILSILASQEIAARQGRLVKTRITQAQFPVIKSLDAFEFSFPKSINKSLILNLFDLHFAEEKHNVIIMGPPGTRKPIWQSP